MNDKTLKLWQLVLTVAIQLIVGGIWAGAIGADVRQHGKTLTTLEGDVKRMDNEGPSVWRNTLRFSDKEADQVKRDLEAMRAEMQTQRQILVRIEQQLKN